MKSSLDFSGTAHVKYGEQDMALALSVQFNPLVSRKRDPGIQSLKHSCFYYSSFVPSGQCFKATLLLNLLLLIEQDMILITGVQLQLG